MKTISIILVSYNNAEHIVSCLDSIFAQDFKDYEVIVIDNASVDETRAILKKTYSNIKLIKNSKNYGFGKAVNQGIAKSTGKFILCLNDDIKLNIEFLSNILKPMGSQPMLGAIQPKVLRANGAHIDTTGIFLSNFRRFYDIGSGQLDTGKFNKPRYIFGACAAASLYRKEALEAIKQNNEYFDEDFFCIAEDVDISWRIQKHGWQTLYFPEAVCTHSGGISRNRNVFTQYFALRNRYLMILKNESLAGFLRYIFVFFLYDLWRNLYMLIENPKYFSKSSYEILKLSPKMVKKRWAKYYD